MKASRRPALAGEQVRERLMIGGHLGMSLGLAALLAGSSLVADSSALLAIALGKLSQVLALGVRYFAVGRSARWDAIASALTAMVVLVLSAGVVYHAASGFLEGSRPLGAMVMGMAVLAACAQAWIIGSSERSTSRQGAESATVFDDFVPSLSVVAAGALVLVFGANWPDLVVALILAALAGYAASKKMRDAKRQLPAQREV